MLLKNTQAVTVIVAACLCVCATLSYPQAQHTSETHGKGRPGKCRITAGSGVLWVEVADEPASRARGLMHRHTMPPDEGMLFVFDTPGILSFWMRDTILPLDIAFIGMDRRIVNIISMEPLDTALRYRSAGPAQYALEVHRGWFAKHKVKPGDRVDF